MKKYALFTVAGLSALLIGLSAFKNSETKEKTAVHPYVLVEIYEIPAYDDKGVHIHWGAGKTEIIHFKEFVAHNHDENGDIILQAINKVAAEGYELTHATSGLGDKSGMITKLIFQKVD